jgi:hypothetical protein
MFTLSLIGYLCLPDMIRMWRSGCTFMTITDKKMLSEDSNINKVYFLDDKYQTFDKTTYNTGDLVCVKMKK